ncbi:MAG: hypothetical protein KF886_12780 [Candidatus Hydrogenedentes bacterium]|nr:hypothetical protein [Candidatus Hydrogenedentota bacterium]
MAPRAASGASVWVNHAGPLGRTTAPVSFPLGSLVHVDSSSGGGRVAMGHATIYHSDLEPMFLGSVTTRPRHPQGFAESLDCLPIPDIGHFNASVVEGMRPIEQEGIVVAGEFKPLGQLVLSAVLEDGEAAPCAGYCSANPARKYYYAGSDVTVSAHTGRPLGTDSFLSRLEAQLGRRLRALPVGRPRRVKTGDNWQLAVGSWQLTVDS